MLNQLQHRLKRLMLSVKTEPIQDSLAFTLVFLNMPRDLSSSCLYVSVLHHCVAEYSQDKLLTWERSRCRTKLSRFEGQNILNAEIKCHLASITRNIHAHLWRALLYRQKLLSLNMMHYALRCRVLFFPCCWFGNRYIFKCGRCVCSFCV